MSSSCGITANAGGTLKQLIRIAFYQHMTVNSGTFIAQLKSKKAEVGSIAVGNICSSTNSIFSKLCWCVVKSTFCFRSGSDQHAVELVSNWQNFG